MGVEHGELELDVVGVERAPDVVDEGGEINRVNLFEHISFAAQLQAPSSRTHQLISNPVQAATLSVHSSRMPHVLSPNNARFVKGPAGEILDERNIARCLVAARTNVS
mgnify:FL=1